MKFSIKDYFSKCDQSRRFLRIWLHLLKKSLMENFIFCVVWTKMDTEASISLRFEPRNKIVTVKDFVHTYM